MKHVYEKVFTSDSGMRRNVPKVLVVVTDGRSQDDVKKSAEKLQHSGICVPVLTFDVAQNPPSPPPKKKKNIPPKQLWQSRRLI